MFHSATVCTCFLKACCGITDISYYAIRKYLFWGIAFWDLTSYLYVSTWHYLTYLIWTKKVFWLKLPLSTILDGPFYWRKTLIMRLWLLLPKRTSAVNLIEENIQPLVLWAFCLFDKLKFVGVNYTEYYWQACYNCKVFDSKNVWWWWINKNEP